jgi:hypothetical protein
MIPRRSRCSGAHMILSVITQSKEVGRLVESEITNHHLITLVESAVLSPPGQ